MQRFPPKPTPPGWVERGTKLVRPLPAIKPVIEPYVFRRPAVSADGKGIHLTASATIDANTSATGVNVDALAAPQQGAIEIDAIKFSLRTTSETGVNCTTLGSIIGAQFELVWLPPHDQRPPIMLTKGFIPVWLFGQMHPYAEWQRTAAVLPTDVYSEFCWKLDKPLYVPKGMVLRPTLRHYGFLSTAVVARVSYEARQLPLEYGPPATAALPYVCTYLSNKFTVDGAVQTDTSAETDLANPFTESLHVTRFVGRSPVVYATSLGAGIDDLLFSNYDVAEDVLIRMQASSGDPVVRDKTQFLMVFDRVTRAWEVGHDLPSQGYYIVRVDANPNLTVVGITFNHLQLQIGMVGWRELPFNAITGGQS